MGTTGLTCGAEPGACRAQPSAAELKSDEITRAAGRARNAHDVELYMDALALILTLAALVMFALAASGRELRRFNEIALGLVFLTAALICQCTGSTNTHIGR